MKAPEIIWVVVERETGKAVYCSTTRKEARSYVNFFSWAYVVRKYEYVPQHMPS
jgi:hypothetical protein